VFVFKLEAFTRSIMRILYLTQFLSATGGGGDVVFCDLAKGMLELGHEVHIICHQMTNPEANNLQGANMHKIKPVIEDRAGYFLSISEHIKYVINALIKGATIIRKNKIEIIHANTISPAIPASILGKIFNVPVITTVHVVYTGNLPNYWKQWSSQDKVSHVSSIIAPLYEKIVLKMSADNIHSVSNSTKNDLIKSKSKSKIFVIPNGIDLGEYNSDKIKIDYGEFVLFIARLVFNKNLNVVITSFKEVVEKIPNAKLVVVGDGPMRNEWEKMVRDMNLSRNIIFVGYISQKEKIDLLSKCSALVLPSFVEGFALTPLEAFAMSKPALLSNIPSSRELVDDNVDGFILPPHDKSKWAEKIIFLLSNKKISERMGQNARKKMQEKYDISVIHSKMQQLYIELSKKSNTSSG
jgi:glycosyltransferase involved in cell wall biosynthesis